MATLYDYYTGKGDTAGATKWNSATRLADAQKAGIQNYAGTADQNNQLLSYLSKPTAMGVQAVAPRNTSTTTPALASGQAKPATVTAPVDTSKPFNQTPFNSATSSQATSNPYTNGGLTPVGGSNPYSNGGLTPMTSNSPTGSNPTNNISSNTQPNTSSGGNPNNLVPPATSSNPNGLTPEQIAQGYSTVAGNFDPVTGKAKVPVIPQLPSTPAFPTGTPATGTGTGYDANSGSANYAGGQPTAQAGLIQRAIDIISNQNPQMAANLAEQNRIINEGATARENNAMDAKPITDMVNRSGAIQNIASARTSALQGTYTQMQGDQQRNLNALLTASGQMAPIQMSPESTLYQPTGGSSIAGLGGAGSTGAQNLNLATMARTNAGLGAGFQQQGAQISTALRNVDAIAPAITQFLSSTGINEGSAPWTRQTLQDIYSQTNPAALATFKEMNGNLRSSIQQILGASGFAPTDAAEMSAGFDISLLSPAEITAFIQNMKSTGEIKLKQIQDSMNSSYGANIGGINPYGGTTAPNTVSFQPTAQSGSLAGAIGGGMGAVGGLSGGTSAMAAIQGIAKYLKF